MDQEIQVNHIDIESLIPYARNARTHSDSQVAQLAASIKEFGWTNPILVDGEKGIIAGHGRLLAARKLGHDKVPVIELKNLTETQKRAYILADNKLAINAGWDSEMLGLELEELGAELDLTIAGFSPGEIEGLLEGGWTSDIGALDSTEANLDGVQEKIVVRLDGTFVEEVTSRIKAYCDEHAINIEIS